MTKLRFVGGSGSSRIKFYKLFKSSIFREKSHGDNLCGRQLLHGFNVLI